MGTRIMEDRDLYPLGFSDLYGATNEQWIYMTDIDKEILLRHQMVCKLVCNLETVKKRSAEEILSYYPKRQKFDSSTSGSSSSAEIVLQVQQDEAPYRYIMIEGDTMAIHTQNTLCQLHGIPKLEKKYDIFDKQTPLFIEVKVSSNPSVYLSNYEEYIDNTKYCGLIVFNQETGEPHRIGIDRPLPGESKATNWLLSRQTKIAVLGLSDPKDESSNYLDSVWSRKLVLNAASDWEKLYYAFKDLGFDGRTHQSEHLIEFDPVQLSELIEDTRTRDTGFMQYHGKLLPSYWKDSILTEKEKDYEMVDEIATTLLSDDPLIRFVNEVINRMRSLGKNSAIFPKRMNEEDRKLLQWVGLGKKKTILNDDSDELIQPEFEEKQKRRYSGWMSNLVVELAKNDDSGLTFFNELVKQECNPVHPFAKTVEETTTEYFKAFSKTRVACFTNEVKNLYSRLGGVYSSGVSREFANVVVMPIQSTGTTAQGETKRLVSGFLIKGPSHPKKQSDKIPFVSIELLDNNQSKYFQFIKNATIVQDENNRYWCVRQNSINKNDPPYLTFIVNSTFLSANMLGEFIMSNPLVKNRHDFLSMGKLLLGKNKDWCMERVSESVLMALLGSSDEEGAMAIVRKIFMLSIVWSRKQAVWGWDIKGLADSLNECLIDRPLSLYYGMQIKKLLLTVAEQMDLQD